MVDKQEIAIGIHEYFSTFYKKELKDSDNLFDKGVLDSMGIISLITHIEVRFGATVEPEEITEDNFKTINSIAELLAKK